MVSLCSSPIGFVWRTTLLEKPKERLFLEGIRHSCSKRQCGKLGYFRWFLVPHTQVPSRLSTTLLQYHSKLKFCSKRIDKLSCCLKDNLKELNCSVILLAGGSGKRMKTTIPKQYLLLHGKPVLEYSLEIFLSVKQVFQIVIVMDLYYKTLLRPHLIQDSRIEFACPGKERQDSVYNGLQKVKSNADLVCIHDAARPLISKETIQKVFDTIPLSDMSLLNIRCSVSLTQQFMVQQ